MPTSPSPTGSKRSVKKPTTVAGVIVALLIGGYTLLRPAINEATGWNLPAPATETSQPFEPSPAKVETARVETAQAKAEASKPIQTSPAKKTSGPLADRAGADRAGADRVAAAKPSPSPASKPTSQPASRPAPSRVASPSVRSSDADLKYGLLREIQTNRFISPAGLLYTPGSAEGHRLEHLKRHTEDQPTRPGKHGVFDGGMEKALLSVDQAYEKAKLGVRTTTQEEEGRTVYTVDMGRRVGFIGGRDGGRQRNPMARRIRIVLDGNRVITAFPM